MPNFHRVLGALALAGCSAATETPRPEESLKPLPAAADADLRRTLDEVVSRGVAPGVSLALQKPGHLTWRGSSGVASLATSAALTPRERFRAGSMLKTFVATAVLELVEEGTLELNDSAAVLLSPAVAARIPRSGDITLRMLLDHTSGLAEFSDAEFDRMILDEPTRIWSFDEMLDRALEHGSLFDPGAGWFYSNTNYLLLGEVLQRATGQPWRRSLREEVFARAGLTESSLPEEGDARCEGCSRGYELIAGEPVDLTEIDPSMAGPAGGEALVTTPGDLVKFLAALESGRLFDDPATLELMLDFTDAPVPEEAQTGYGLGIARFRAGDAEFIGHLGATAGFQGFVLVHRESGLVVSGCMNTRGDLGGFILPVLEAAGRL